MLNIITTIIKRILEKMGKVKHNNKMGKVKHNNNNKKKDFGENGKS